MGCLKLHILEKDYKRVELKIVHFKKDLSLEKSVLNTFKATSWNIRYNHGNAYSAPIAYIKTKGNSSGSDIDEYHYLHRDYLGSILAITNSSKRATSVWGLGSY